MSDKTVQEMEQNTKMRSKRVLLQKYEINFDRMKTLMQAIVEQMIKKDADEVRITQDEAHAIYSKMSTRSHGQKTKGLSF